MNEWDYPAGADNSEAPWNEEEKPEIEVPVTVYLTLKKEVTVRIDRYKGDAESPDIDNDDLKQAVIDQVVLPHNFVPYIQSVCNMSCSLRSTDFPLHIQNASEDCSGWEEESMEVE